MKRFGWFLLLLISSISLFAEDRWIQLEQGKLKIEEGEFGEALALLNELILENSVYPEAEYWKGRVFEEEGEFILAERQYEKSLEIADYLYLPEMRYSILYRLAHLYRNALRTEDWENILKKIIEEEPFYLDSDNIERLHRMNTILRNEGLDRLFFLYRQRLSFSTRAHSEIGYLSFHRGDWDSAESYLLLSVLNHLTTLFDGLRQYLPHYEFSSVSAFLEEASKRRDLMAYMQDSSLYEDLYRLAQVLYYSGSESAQRRNSARSLWMLIEERPESGNWGERARRQGEEPFREPLLFSEQ